MSEAEREGGGRRNRAPKKWRWMMLLVVIVIMAGAASGYYVMSGRSAMDGGNLKHTRVGAVEVTPGGAGSPRYNRLMREANEQAAQEALDRGESFVPTPIKERKDLAIEDMIGQEEEEESPVEPKDESSPVPDEPHWALPPSGPDVVDARGAVGSGVEVSPEDERALSEYFAKLAERWQALPGGKSVVYDNSAYLPKADESASGESTAPDVVDYPAGLVPGLLLPVTNRLVLDTDRPGSPVVLDVVHGEFRGYQAHGVFERSDDRLLARVTRLISPVGEVIPVTAIVVDLNKSSVYLADDVNYRTITRWLALIGAPMLEGVGELVASSGTETTMIDGTVYAERTETNTADKIAVGLGKAGAKMSDLAVDYFNRPPTVKVFADGRVLYGLLIQDVGRVPAVPAARRGGAVVGGGRSELNQEEG